MEKTEMKKTNGVSDNQEDVIIENDIIEDDIIEDDIIEKLIEKFSLVDEHINKVEVLGYALEQLKKEFIEKDNQITHRSIAERLLKDDNTSEHNVTSAVLQLIIFERIKEINNSNPDQSQEDQEDKDSAQEEINNSDPDQSQEDKDIAQDSLNTQLAQALSRGLEKLKGLGKISKSRELLARELLVNHMLDSEDATKKEDARKKIVKNIISIELSGGILKQREDDIIFSDIDKSEINAANLSVLKNLENEAISLAGYNNYDLTKGSLKIKSGKLINLSDSYSDLKKPEIVEKRIDMLEQFIYANNKDSSSKDSSSKDFLEIFNKIKEEIKSVGGEITHKINIAGQDRDVKFQQTKEGFTVKVKNGLFRKADVTAEIIKKEKGFGGLWAQDLKELSSSIEKNKAEIAKISGYVADAYLKNNGIIDKTTEIDSLSINEAIKITADQNSMKIDFGKGPFTLAGRTAKGLLKKSKSEIQIAISEILTKKLGGELIEKKIKFVEPSEDDNKKQSSDKNHDSLQKLFNTFNEESNSPINAKYILVNDVKYTFTKESKDKGFSVAFTNKDNKKVKLKFPTVDSFSYIGKDTLNVQSLSNSILQLNNQEIVKSYFLKTVKDKVNNLYSGAETDIGIIIDGERKDLKIEIKREFPTKFGNLIPKRLAKLLNQEKQEFVYFGGKKLCSKSEFYKKGDELLEEKITKVLDLQKKTLQSEETSELEKYLREQQSSKHESSKHGTDPEITTEIFPEIKLKADNLVNALSSNSVNSSINYNKLSEIIIRNSENKNSAGRS